MKKISNLLIIIAILYILSLGIITIVKAVNIVEKVIKEKQLPYSEKKIISLPNFNVLKVSGEGLLIIVSADKNGIITNKDFTYSVKGDTLFMQLSNSERAFKLLVKDLNALYLRDYVKVIFSRQGNKPFNTVLSDYSTLFLQVDSIKRIDIEQYESSEMQIISGQIRFANALLKDEASLKIYAQLDTIDGFSDTATTIELLKYKTILLKAEGKVIRLRNKSLNINL